MKVIATQLDGVLIFGPRVYGDERGHFFESINQTVFDAAVGRATPCVQDNHSHSVRGVLRGLHYQAGAKAQGKLVRVVRGTVFDVAVDIRRGSPNYGRWFGVELSAANCRQLWLPAGMAHGFLVISESADFLYKATTYYAPEAERCIRWNDPAIGIDWPDLGLPPSLSARDAAAGTLAEAVD
jgi:dTDP-4-dehydrorhamnose 3,5-epimerase